MKYFLKSIIVSLAITLTLSTPALAYSSFVGANNTITGSYNTSQAAYDCYNATGYTPYYHYNEFTFMDIMNEIGLVRAVHIYAHGQNAGKYMVNFPGTIELQFQTDDGTLVDADELYGMTKGYYKFAFLDSCNSGDSKAYYYAFNMKDGDTGHAVLGWKGVASTDFTWQTFSIDVYNDLKSNKTVNTAVWNAYVNTGIDSTHYQIFGDYNTTLN